ncbi:MAG: YCF48-related protein [Saprospiraceae bacterium]|nr:YCF48-related protein [Saprospiraceae bacterium]MDG2418728.1 YCF48-related protein [Saprospiraceae bacterium]
MKINSLLFISLFTFFLSCKKETFYTSWIEHDVPTDLTLNAVHLSDDSTVHIVGGNVWNDDIYLKSTDAGATWVLDSLNGKEIYDMQFNPNNNGFAVAWGGDFYSKESPADNWSYHNLGFPFETFRGVSFWEKENGIIITGAAYQNGKIIQVNESFEATLVDSFEQELSAVFHSEKEIIHIVGYGIVLRSNDGGNTWEKKDIFGDFFRAIHFPSSNVGYAVGQSGSIIKTIDAGKHWKFIRNGDAISTSNKSFRSVFFIDEEHGYVVGHDGLFWRTKNGGANWETMPDLPEVDLHDIFIRDRKGFIVGKKGKIFSFQL